MAGILTQAEVDALLSAVTLGEVIPVFGGESPQARRVETWELDRPRNSVELRGLDLVHDAFAEAASSSLTGLLSLPVVVARHSLSRIRMADYVPAMPLPSMIYQVRLAAEGPEILIQIGAGTILSMVERLFGGPVVSGGTERPLTMIEKSVLKWVLQKLLLDLARAWARFRVFEPEIVNVEAQPELLRFVAPTEPLSLTTFEFRLAETAGFVTLAYPEAFLHETFAQADEQEKAPLEPALAGPLRDSLSRRLAGTRVPVVVELGTARLTLRELAGLKVGDVIPLEMPVEGALSVSVGGVPKFLARPGQKGGRLAISITGKGPEPENAWA